MAGTLTVDTIQSDSSYASRINVTSNVAFTSPVNFTGGIQVGGQDATFGGMRNRIINGAMMIDQRNAGSSVTPTNGTYTLDRFLAYQSAASKFSVQRNAGSVTPPTGFSNYLGVTSLSSYSISSSDYFELWHKIEGFNCADLSWGTASAATVTLSFWVRSSLTGTFGGAIKNDAQTRAYPFTYTINQANTWEKETITIPGEQSGAWLTNNGPGVNIVFGLGVGSTYSGTAGAWANSGVDSATGAVSVVGTNGATWYITGVQLEKGSTASSFEYRPYGTELQLCQRYFEYGFTRSLTSTTFSGSYNPDHNWFTQFKVEKRGSPTVTRSNATDTQITFNGITPNVYGFTSEYDATSNGQNSSQFNFSANSEL
jgi:hypothetical protein